MCRLLVSSCGLQLILVAVPRFFGDDGRRGCSGVYDVSLCGCEKQQVCIDYPFRVLAKGCVECACSPQRVCIESNSWQFQAHYSNVRESGLLWCGCLR